MASLSGTTLPEPTEKLLEEYFGQLSVHLDTIGNGRSGATTYVARPSRSDGTTLQPELVKVGPQASISSEIVNFEKLVEGTALVHGASFPRDAVTRDGLQVFSLRLFEAGTDVSAFFERAMTDHATSRESLRNVLERLVEWYAMGADTSVCTELPITAVRLQSGLRALDTLDHEAAVKCEEVLKNVVKGGREHCVSKVHGDLHLENLLIAIATKSPYVIDFGTASAVGNPCFDLARLESDILNRVVPLHLSADDFAKIEQSLWTDSHATHISEIVELIDIAREVFQPILQTPHAKIWLLAGRILNNLRMISGTWPEIYPYRFRHCQERIVKAIRVLLTRLEEALNGVDFPLRHTGQVTGVPKDDSGELSLGWLYCNRKYADAFDLAKALKNANPNRTVTVAAFGALVEPMVNRPEREFHDPPAADCEFGKGLLQLVEANNALQGPIRDVGAGAGALELAIGYFKDSDSPQFQAIAVDQLARANQHAGDIETAKIRFGQSISIKTAVGDSAGLAASYGGLALLHMACHQYQDADRLLAKNLATCAPDDQMTLSKIENWLGQIQLEEYFELAKAREHFSKARLLAIDPSTQAYAYLGRGFTEVRAQSTDQAEKFEELARNLYNSETGRFAREGLLLTELLSGEVQVLAKNHTTGILRISNALNTLSAEGSQITCLDYGLRTCKLLQSIGRSINDTGVPAILNKTKKSLKISFEYSNKIEEILG